MKPKKRFSAKKSQLPKWLLERGVEVKFGFAEPIYWLYDALKNNETKLKTLQDSYNKMKNNSSKEVLKNLNEMISRTKKEIKDYREMINDFQIDHFEANDVEKVYREAINK